MALLLRILILLMIIIQGIGGTSLCVPRSEFSCPKSCKCYFPNNILEIRCENVTVRFDQRRYIEIECTQFNATNYDTDLRAMTACDVPTVQIKTCPLARIRSLNIVLNQLGIRNVRSLFLESFGKDSGATLIRDHLHAFNGLERLDLHENDLSYLPTDVFHDLKNLTTLNLDANQIHLTRDIFENLENLQLLNLGHNNLHSLEPGIFRNQKHLKYLNLWGNNFFNLTKDSFQGASSLEDLNLDANKLTTLNADLFELLTNLKNISVSANNFTSLPDGLFANNKRLTLVRLLYNRQMMEKLPSRFLADLPELKYVIIQESVSEIPGDMFSGSEQIQNMTLIRNGLTKLPNEIFASQSNLIDLNLSQNELIELPDDIFANTGSLLVLNLAYNNLEIISRKLFGRLNKLVELQIHNNNLHHIPVDAFTETLNLRIINLENNHLKYFSISESSNLESLNLKNNSISRMLGDWAFTCMKLRVLDLSYNNITNVHVWDLQFLQTNLEVSLAHNAIAEIDFSQNNSISKTIRISVDIRNNPLVCNCKILDFVKFMSWKEEQAPGDYFNIISGEMKCAGPENLSGLAVRSVELEEFLCPLDSPWNPHKTCPIGCTCNVSPMSRTIIVNCSGLALTVVPPLPDTKHFSVQSNSYKLDFIELHVERNNLTKLPNNNHPGYDRVSRLYASDNNINELTIDNIQENLSILDLSKNSLTWINPSIFEALNTTNQQIQLFLGENPWQCDCRAKPLLTFVHAGLIQDLDSMICSSGAKFVSLTPADLCKQNMLLLLLPYMIAIFGLFFGIIASLFYKFQMEIKVWLFAHNMCLRLVTEKELDKYKKFDAFVSYSSKDENFVIDLQETLESGPEPYKLCLHERDWVPGEYIPTQIIRSVVDSRRTIVVLSPNFLKSMWGLMEFQAAHKVALEEGRFRVLIIIYGDIGSIDNLDPELQAYLKMNTYVKWGDPWFWKKLRYAMPHKSTYIHPESNGLLKNTLKNTLSDKLELISNIPATPSPLTTPLAEEASQNPLLSKLNGNMKNCDPHLPYSQQNGNIANYLQNGHVNNAFIINSNEKRNKVADSSNQSIFNSIEI